MSLEVPIIILILAIPFYFLSRWVFKKIKLGNEQNRKYLAIIPAVIISSMLYIGIVLIGVFSMTYYPNIDFNKQKWDENQEKRYKMSKDIIKSEMLIGKTKEEVIELLGKIIIPMMKTISPMIWDLCLNYSILIRMFWTYILKMG